MANRGFTLIELIVTITLVAVLMTVAVPRFSNTTSIARASLVQAMAGTVNSVANQIHLVWAATSGDMGGVPITLSGGTVVHVFNGYPDAGNCCSPTGIENAVNSSGFTVNPFVNSHTRWSVTNAPDPTKCQVTYQEAATAGAVFLVTTDTTGC